MSELPWAIRTVAVGCGLTSPYRSAQKDIGAAGFAVGARTPLLRRRVLNRLKAVPAIGELLERLKVRAAACHAAETAVQSANMLTAEAGAISILESSPLKLTARDIHATTKHIAMSSNIYATMGRVELGLDTGAARFTADAY